MRVVNLIIIAALFIAVCIAEWPKGASAEALEVATYVQPGCTAAVWLEWQPALTGTNWIPIAVTRYTFPMTNPAAFFRSRTEWVTNGVSK